MKTTPLTEYKLPNNPPDDPMQPAWKHSAISIRNNCKLLADKKSMFLALSALPDDARNITIHTEDKHVYIKFYSQTLLGGYYQINLVEKAELSHTKM